MLNRIGTWLYNLDRWQETSLTVARLRRWIQKKHDAFWTERYKALQASIRELTGLSTSVLMSGNSKRKRPKVAAQVAKLEKRFTRFDGNRQQREQLQQEMMRLRLTCGANKDPDTREAQPGAVWLLPPPYVCGTKPADKVLADVLKAVNLPPKPPAPPVGDPPLPHANYYAPLAYGSENVAGHPPMPVPAATAP